MSAGSTAEGCQSTRMARAPAGERKQGEYRRQVEVLALVLQAFRTPQGGQAPAINDSDIINASLVDYKAHILVTTVYRTSVTVDKARQVIHANAELLQQEKPPFYVNLTEAIKDGMSKSEICSGIKRQDYWNNLRGGLKLRGRDFEIDANVNHQGESICSTGISLSHWRADEPSAPAFLHSFS